MNCQRAGCAAAASGRLRLCVPGVGGGIKPNDCINVVIGVLICQPHFEDEKKRLPVWLSSEMRRSVEIVAGQKALPDFDRAFLLLDKMQ